jgi:hypothetical protein
MWPKCNGGTMKDQHLKASGYMYARPLACYHSPAFAHVVLFHTDHSMSNYSSTLFVGLIQEYHG